MSNNKTKEEVRERIKWQIIGKKEIISLISYLAIARERLF